MGSRKTALVRSIRPVGTRSYTLDRLVEMGEDVRRANLLVRYGRRSGRYPVDVYARQGKVRMDIYSAALDEAMESIEMVRAGYDGRDADALEMRFVDGRKYGEIAADLGYPSYADTRSAVIRALDWLDRQG